MSLENMSLAIGPQDRISIVSLGRARLGALADQGFFGWSSERC